MIISTITAIIGYFINDLYDINDDLKAGKKNYVSGFPVWLKILFLPFFIFILVILWIINEQFLFIKHANLYTLTFFANTFLFLMYSVPPIRFKKAVYIAPILDALYSGALFYMLAFILATIKSPINKPAIIMILIWSFLKGLRNYFSHLCDDKENDESSGTVTLATAYGKQQLQKIANLIFPLEIICLMILQIVLIKINYLFIVLCLFFIILWLKKIKEDATVKYPFLNELHEIYLPLIMLFQVVFMHHSLYLILILHFIFFPFHVSKIYFTVKNSIFKLFNKEPISWKELFHGKK